MGLNRAVMCNKHNLLLVLEMENGMALRIVQVIEPGDFRNITRSHGRQDRAKGRTGGIFPVSRPGQENVPVSFMSRHVKRIYSQFLICFQLFQ